MNVYEARTYREFVKACLADARTAGRKGIARQVAAHLKFRDGLAAPMRGYRLSTFARGSRMRAFVRRSLLAVAVGFLPAAASCRHGADLEAGVKDDGAPVGTGARIVLAPSLTNVTGPPIEPAGRSAAESAAAAHARWRASEEAAGRTPKGLGLFGETARDLALPTATMQVKAVSWTAEQLQKGFEVLRDTQLQAADLAMPLFPRRLTWLYPDDGCFARAGLAGYILVDAGYPGPGNVFLFGDLTVKSANSPTGAVSWTYHVAPVVSVGTVTYVLDPAIDPKHPLTLDAWVAAQAPSAAVTLSFCDQGSMDPNGACLDGDDPASLALNYLRQSYFEREWSRQGELGRVPQVVLGNAPPWKQQ